MPQGNVDANGVYPIVRGSVVDFDAFQKLLEKAFEELRLKPEEASIPVGVWAL
jgi:actin-related protein